jgi:hypothetical protein
VTSEITGVDSLYESHYWIQLWQSDINLVCKFALCHYLVLMAIQLERSLGLLMPSFDDISSTLFLKIGRAALISQP